MQEVDHCRSSSHIVILGVYMPSAHCASLGEGSLACHSRLPVCRNKCAGAGSSKGYIVGDRPPEYGDGR